MNAPRLAGGRRWVGLDLLTVHRAEYVLDCLYRAGELDGPDYLRACRALGLRSAWLPAARAEQAAHLYGWHLLGAV